MVENMLRPVTKDDVKAVEKILKKDSDKTLEILYEQLVRHFDDCTKKHRFELIHKKRNWYQKWRSKQQNTYYHILRYPKGVVNIESDIHHKLDDDYIVSELMKRLSNYKQDDSQYIFKYTRYNYEEGCQLQISLDIIIED